MAAAVELPPPAPSIHPNHMNPDISSCPACGTSVPVNSTNLEEARRRVAELEAQMELLKERTIAAVDKCTGYEDQIRSLKAAQSRQNFSGSSNTNGPSRQSNEEPRPATAGATSTRQSRFSFFAGRRTSPNNSTSQPPLPNAPTPADVELLNELERERSLRAKAEARAQKVDSEIEELSVQLFSQANEMVAEERRARAKLEERVEMLEKKDKDKAARLERLEKAVTRIDRVKAMLNQSTPTVVPASNPMLAPPGRR